jgi:integrase
MAQVWLAEQQTLLAKGEWSQKREQTPVLFKGFAESHIDLQTTSKGKPLHGSTKALYARLLNNDLGEFHGTEIKAISGQQIDQWWKRKTSTGKLTTASKAYKLLHAVLNRALVEGKISSNPCRVRGAHTATTGKELYVPSVEEVGALVSASPTELKAALLIASYGGLRFGEWSALSRQDLEIISDSGQTFFRVHVTKAYSRIGKSTVLGPTKSADGVRTVDMSSQLTAILSQHLLAHSAPAADGPLFLKPNGDAMSHDYFIRRFNKAAALAGLSKLTPHALRHFGATQKVRLGMNFADLRKWLGDSTNQAALGYVHASHHQQAQFREMPVSDSLLNQVVIA